MRQPRPQPHHMSPISPATSLPSSSSIASVDNVLDQSFLLSTAETGEWGKPKTVTRLVPYRIKKIESELGASPATRKERATKDEKAARLHNLPYTVDFIINCNMDEFGDILNNKSLNNEQLNLCRDIRKRGKNKIAARNCRKRKGEIILVLEEELEVVRQTKQRTMEARDQLLASHAAWRLRLESLERRVLDQ